MVFSYRDRIYIGDIILDDVVIRYAGIHDAAFDVNCEERRSRFCFIPLPFLLLPKDVQIFVGCHTTRVHSDPVPGLDILSKTVNHFLATASSHKKPSPINRYDTVRQ